MNPSYSKWTTLNVSRCKYLHADVREIFLEFILRIAEEGIYLRISEDGGKRTAEQQLKLYNKRPRVTWVKCPNSYHCHGLAVDIIPMKRIGSWYYKPLWTSASTYERMARIAKELGISWGYDEWGMDKGHFHYRGNKNLSQIIAGKYPKKPTFAKIKYHRETERVVSRLKANAIIDSTHFPYLFHGNT